MSLVNVSHRLVIVAFTMSRSYGARKHYSKTEDERLPGVHVERLCS